MALQGLDHINIDTCQPDDTVAFYTDVLGLENFPERRPDFGFPGAWLWANGRAVVHLNFIDRDERFGADGVKNRNAFNHIAFEGTDFAAMCAVLDDRGLDYTTSVRDDIGLSQIFVNDPNDIRVEINIQH